MQVGVQSLVAIAAFVGLTGSGPATPHCRYLALQTAPVVAALRSRGPASTAWSRRCGRQ